MAACMLLLPSAHILSHHIRISSTFSFRLLHKNTKEISGGHGCCVTVKSRYGCQCWHLQVYSTEQTTPKGRRLMRLSYHFLVCCTSSQAAWVVTWEREEQSTQTYTNAPACTHTHTHSHTHTHTDTTMFIMFNGFCGKLPNSVKIFLFFSSLFPPSLPLSHLYPSPLWPFLFIPLSLFGTAYALKPKSPPPQQFTTTILMKETTQHREERDMRCLWRNNQSWYTVCHTQNRPGDTVPSSSPLSKSTSTWPPFYSLEFFILYLNIGVVTKVIATGLHRRQRGVEAGQECGGASSNW